MVDMGTEQRSRQGWDIALTIVLLVVLAAVAAVATFLGVFLVFMSDACGAKSCDAGLMGTGWMIAVVSPGIAWLITVGVSIWGLVARRRGFWIPLLGFVAICVFWFVGAWIMFIGADASL